MSAGKAISSALVRSSRFRLDLVEAHGEAADRRPRSALELIRSRGVLGGRAAVVLDVLGRELAGDHQRAAVVGDHRALAAQVAGDVLELARRAGRPAASRLGSSGPGRADAGTVGGGRP